MEVLLEYKNSRRALKVTAHHMLETVEKELIALGAKRPVVELAGVERSQRGTHLILQRWSSKWEAYVDVSNVWDITEGDKLVVIPRPAASGARVSLQACIILHYSYMLLYILCTTTFPEFGIVYERW